MYHGFYMVNYGIFKNTMVLPYKFQNITVVGYHVQKTFFVSKKIPKFSMALPCFGGNIIVKRCHNPPKNIVNVSDRTLSKSTVMVQKWHKMVIP